ncbi:oxygen-independent coproporphyrinogen III oxidase [Paracoccus seriniphilus]|uniref:Coproporphyrinogen-III oxidase n=1 Tax=Paracoccus seriniphilus TaxID=184748 RepID=A0A239PMM3_9RHOB|nr:oxygen-independent coproporphyrinogen III oxidase [Paracoccus seriniphilus]WCR13612.1 oxygen-independent coproporphyrinogen III oxidase [Paracoccus seriniphilus]SNT68795.1 oxygen-independent coproporphyrinogen-3 oxidase [Paracoccus seriniphilus]
MKQVSQLQEYGLFDARVPRYTSYPPANHFAAEGISDLAQDWIAAIPAGCEISLYVHVPFCRRLCWFCACRTQGTQSLDPVRIYVETLLSELRQLRARMPEGVRLSRLHWGGGTPTLLPPDLIMQLAGAIFDTFPLSEQGEFSVEIDPTEIDAPRMAALAAAGMNRASIGVQDFNPDIQAAIGRPQSFQVTAQAVSMIRDHGIESLNADILYGLPHQDNMRMAETVQKLMALSPDRVALYGYAHVPWMSKRQVMIPEQHLPDPRSRLTLFQTARQLFLADGFSEIGIDHFARPNDSLARARNLGRLRRNFQGYTDDRSQILLGLGASSISRFPQGYAQNAPATGAYTALVRAGRLPSTRGHVFSAEDRWRGRMIESLMCHFHIETAEMVRDYGISPSQLTHLYGPIRAKFRNLVRVTPHAFHITQEGRPLTRIIAQQFDAYASGPNSHSQAV